MSGRSSAASISVVDLSALEPLHADSSKATILVAYKIFKKNRIESLIKLLDTLSGTNDISVLVSNIRFLAAAMRGAYWENGYEFEALRPGLINQFNEFIKAIEPIIATAIAQLPEPSPDSMRSSPRKSPSKQSLGRGGSGGGAGTASPRPPSRADSHLSERPQSVEISPAARTETLTEEENSKLQQWIVDVQTRGYRLAEQSLASPREGIGMRIWAGFSLNSRGSRINARHLMLSSGTRVYYVVDPLGTVHVFLVGNHPKTVEKKLNAFAQNWNRKHKD